MRFTFIFECFLNAISIFKISSIPIGLLDILEVKNHALETFVYEAKFDEFSLNLCFGRVISLMKCLLSRT